MVKFSFSSAYEGKRYVVVHLEVWRQKDLIFSSGWLNPVRNLFEHKQSNDMFRLIPAGDRYNLEVEDDGKWHYSHTFSEGDLGIYFEQVLQVEYLLNKCFPLKDGFGHYIEE